MVTASRIAPAAAAQQLFVIDPIGRLNPAKDSSVALMQAAQRAGLQVWVATLADLMAAESQEAGPAGGHASIAPAPRGALAAEMDYVARVAQAP